MNTGHDDYDRDRSAQAFAAEHPELAAVMEEAATRVLGVRSRETVIGGVFAAVLFVVLLAGRMWWGWDSWALVTLGVTGLLVVSAVIELANARHAPSTRQRGGGRR